MNQIFDKLSLIYGNAFTSFLDDPEWEKILKGQWESAILNMEIEDVSKAIKFLSSSENNLYPTYPPTFVQFCVLGSHIKRKGVLGVRQAFLNATKQNFDDPVTYATAREVGIPFLCLNPDKSFAFFEEIYEKNVDKFLKGHHFPVKPVLEKEKIYLNMALEITRFGKFQALVANYLLDIEPKEDSEMNEIAKLAAEEIKSVKKDVLNRIRIISEISKKYYKYVPIVE